MQVFYAKKLNLEAVSSEENALVYMGLAQDRKTKEMYFPGEGTSRLAADFDLYPGLLSEISKSWLKKLPPKEAALKLIVMSYILARSKVPKRLLYLIARAPAKEEVKPVPFTEFETAPEVLMHFIQDSAYPGNERIREEMWDYITGKDSRCRYIRCGRKIPGRGMSRVYCSEKCQGLQNAENSNKCAITNVSSNPKSKVRSCNLCEEKFWSNNFANRKCEKCNRNQRKRRFSKIAKSSKFLGDSIYLESF